MSKLIYTDEMFDFQNPLNHTITSSGAAKVAQAIHDKYMASGTVVYGRVISGGSDPKWEYTRFDYQTHVGILHDIQEIEKAEPECEHKVERDRTGFYCTECNKALVPKGGWKLAEGEGE